MISPTPVTVEYYGELLRSPTGLPGSRTKMISAADTWKDDVGRIGSELDLLMADTFDMKTLFLCSRQS